MGCGTGVCMTVPNEGNTRGPVCGCDGLTYWNTSVAAHRGMSVKTTGVCTSSVTCGGIAAIDCPGNAFCNYEADISYCSISDPGGNCWVMPSTCPTPGIGFGPRTRACGAPTCGYECQLIKAQTPFSVDTTCPQ